MTDGVHVLYRFFSATGQLLYVGITMHPPERFKNHRDSKEWWKLVVGITVENYNSREELAGAERRAIQIEHPLHNVVHNNKNRTKQRPQPAPEPPPPTPITSELFGGLFSRYRCEEPPSGGLDRARLDAIRACTLCDSTGYRNMYVCNHTDFSAERGRRWFLSLVPDRSDGDV